jgi:hypothetical protein
VLRLLSTAARFPRAARSLEREITGESGGVTSLVAFRKTTGDPFHSTSDDESGCVGERRSLSESELELELESEDTGWVGERRSLSESELELESEEDELASEGARRREDAGRLTGAGGGGGLSLELELELERERLRVLDF